MPLQTVFKDPIGWLEIKTPDAVRRNRQAGLSDRTNMALGGKEWREDDRLSLENQVRGSQLETGRPAPEIVDLAFRQIECQCQIGNERVVTIVEAC